MIHNSSRKSVVCVAPVLRVDVRNYARAVSDQGLLRVLMAGCVYRDDSAVSRAFRAADRILGTSLYRGTEARRLTDEVRRNLLTTHPWPEATLRAARFAGLRSVSDTQFTDSVYAALDRFAAARFRAGHDRLVIAQEDCCLETFQSAHNVGALTLYDLPIAYHTVVRKSLEAEVARYPGVSTQGTHEETFAPNRTSRKSTEIALADHVLVASDYVREGVVGDAGVCPKRVTRIPYGCEPGRPYLKPTERRPVVLYVGHLSIRKGIPRLLEVWKRLGAYRIHTLRLIGKSYLRKEFLDGFAGTFEHLPHVPRSELWAHYTSAQAFVFPSACDGFGLVLNEALSCGTPVVASSNTGAPGFITPGVEGLTYKHGDDDALASCLDLVLSRPLDTSDMGRAAYDLAQRWGWPEYRAEIRKLVYSLLPTNGHPVAK